MNPDLPDEAAQRYEGEVKSMKNSSIRQAAILAVLVMLCMASANSFAKVKAWEGTLTIPTYPWTEDVNPKFWALEGAAEESEGGKGLIVYPYTMQDHLSRTKVDRTYKAFFLENEYLKVTCLPELGGRVHSVLDKTTNREMFYTNSVIKPGMIALRGAWISGGIEWNTGPQGHTVTAVSPVDVVMGSKKDGSAYLEIGNVEKIFRTRWSVRLTLHPGKSYLDEQIRIFNPVDSMSPYYFWNCTAFPNRPTTRFIFPMTLGSDHSGEEFFSWPIHNGKDISWLKNYEIYTSVFAYKCPFDFFGAYEVAVDQGIVQAADHYEVPGKKAWTWGEWDFGLVSQRNLTDEDGPYIEVQSGPLPTQNDYGMLWPRQEVTWREWWYPVHGLGDGFAFATKDAAIQTIQKTGTLELRIIATAKYRNAVCVVSNEEGKLLEKTVDLSPKGPEVVTVDVAESPVKITIKSKSGQILAEFTNPLSIPKRTAPTLKPEKPDRRSTDEEKFLKALKYDRATDRIKARRYYRAALSDDPGYLPALRGLAVLDIEAGLYDRAVRRLTKALKRKPDDDGLSWYFLGVSFMHTGRYNKALDCAARTIGCFGTTGLGHDLAGRVYMRLSKPEKALESFRKAVAVNPADSRAQNHLLLTMHALGQTDKIRRLAKRGIIQNPTDLTPKAVLALRNKSGMKDFAKAAVNLLGEDSFQMQETALLFADLGLFDEAIKLLSEVCLKAIPEAERSPLTLYYLAYFASLNDDDDLAKRYLRQANAFYKDGIFAARPEAVKVFKYAIGKNPSDARAHLHLGNLYAHLGRIDEAVARWTKATRLDTSLSVAFRNLGLYHRQKKDLSKAAGFYIKAISARAGDQTLYRDLAEILIDNDSSEQAIELLESMPFEGHRRSDIIIILARTYVDQERYTEAIELLDSTPYFVNWEGGKTTWLIFNQAHIERGKNLFDKGRFEAALDDFKVGITYPDNLGVGRWNDPDETPAYYWQGRALAALGRGEQAISAWKRGAKSHEGSDEQNKYRQLCSTALLNVK